MAFGTNPTTTGQPALPSNQFPISTVAVPNATGGNLNALQGGPASAADANGNVLAPASVYVYDGNDVAQGATTDAANANSVIGQLKQIKANTASITIGSALPAGTNVIGHVIVDSAGNVSVTSLPALPAGTNVIGHVIVDSASSVAVTNLPALPAGSNAIGSVSVSNFPGTQPVSGTVTANAGTGTFTNQQSNVQTDYDTGAGTQNMTMFGMALPANGGAVAGGTSSNPVRTDPTGTTTQPVSAASLPLPSGAATSAKQPALGTAGAASSDVLSVQGIASMTPLKTDGSGVTQPVSGTVTSNIGTTNGLALDSSVNGVIVSQGSTTSGEKGPLIQGAVTTSAPTYTTAQTSPLSLTTAGALRTDASATTQPVSGAVTATQATGTNLHTVVDSAANVSVTSLPSLPAGANAIGSVTANAGTNLNTSALALESGGNLATVAGAVASSKMQANVAQIAGQTPTLDNTSTLAVSMRGKNSVAGDTAVKVNSSGDQYVLGDFTEQASLSAGSLNADLVASTDVSAYAWISVHITAIATGATLTFQASNDNFATQIENVNLARVSSSTTTSSTTTTTGMYEGPVLFRYFRVRQTAYTSGTSTGVLELFTLPRALNTMPVTANQSGIWTVQPGNTANTTPWLESIHDGTNKANVFGNSQANENALYTAGAFTEQASLSAAALNTDLVASTDVSAYKWFTLQLTGTWTGTITFQGSNDNSTFFSVPVANINPNNSVISAVTNNGVFTGPIIYRYLRVRMTSYTSGTANGTLEVYTTAASVIGTLVPVTQSGTWTVQMPTSATSTITSVVAAASDTSLLASNTNRKGMYIFNDSTAILYLEFGSGVASTSNYTVQVPANGFFEMPTAPVYTGAIRGIWSAANGNARITELT